MKSFSEWVDSRMLEGRLSRVLGSVALASTLGTVGATAMLGARPAMSRVARDRIADYLVKKYGQFGIRRDQIRWVIPASVIGKDYGGRYADVVGNAQRAGNGPGQVNVDRLEQPVAVVLVTPEQIKSMFPEDDLRGITKTLEVNGRTIPYCIYTTEASLRHEITHAVQYYLDINPTNVDNEDFILYLMSPTEMGVRLAKLKRLYASRTGRVPDAEDLPSVLSYFRSRENLLDEDALEFIKAFQQLNNQDKLKAFNNMKNAWNGLVQARRPSGPPVA